MPKKIDMNVGIRKALKKKETSKSQRVMDENQIVDNLMTLITKQMTLLMSNDDDEEGLTAAEWKRMADIMDLLKIMDKRRRDQASRSVLEDLDLRQIDELVQEARRTLGLIDE